MSTVSIKSEDRIDKVFRAFADQTRLRILLVLQDGEHCVSDIITILQIPQAKASHHLNYLLAAGLVEVRKQGLWCFYQLSSGQSPVHDKLLECLEHCCASVPELDADRRRAAKVKAAGGCCPK
jgi:ArsR family transcriptional regulator